MLRRFHCKDLLYWFEVYLPKECWKAELARAHPDTSYVVVEFEGGPPSVPEFPSELAMEIALIPLIFFVYWKRKHRVLQ